MGYPAKAAGISGDPVKPQNISVIDSESTEVESGGTWVQTEDAASTDLTYIYSETAGDVLTLKFKGTGLWMRFYGLPDGGKANITIDGGTAKVLDTYTAAERMRIAFIASSLKQGEHTVKLEVRSDKNSLSSGYKVAVDAFIVELSRGATQIWAMVEEAIALTERALNWYDRNPVSKADEWDATDGDHAATIRVTYTCPTGKIAMIELLSANATRSAAAGAVGHVEVWVNLTPNGGSPSSIWNAGRFYDNDVGAGINSSLGTTVTMFPGDKIDMKTRDTGNGGSVEYQISYKITEFDE